MAYGTISTSSIRNLKFDNISGEAKFFVFERRSWVVSEMVGAFVTMKCLFFFPSLRTYTFLVIYPRRNGIDEGAAGGITLLTKEAKIPRCYSLT